MDILPSGHFFKELQTIHETGYFPAQISLEDKWEQVSDLQHLPIALVHLPTTNQRENSLQTMSVLACWAACRTSLVVFETRRPIELVPPADQPTH